MPINIPMMGRANTLSSAAANVDLDVDFVPPHIIEQQKVEVLHACLTLCLQSALLKHPKHRRGCTQRGINHEDRCCNQQLQSNGLLCHVGHSVMMAVLEVLCYLSHGACCHCRKQSCMHPDSLW